ncbi:hypothetical protein L2E82_46929 [Cichorium intybus]|uniref:Uncharacterized protein n=1 Tax=Cichorium intybus TaxID=13427 RepID=A0ACB8YV41_CICIN|nr:hypothetical protein L2E82_46929 [Cichorium intybus]
MVESDGQFIQIERASRHHKMVYQTEERESLDHDNGGAEFTPGDDDDNGGGGCRGCGGCRGYGSSSSSFLGSGRF